jgi:hypothetical protein
VEDTNLSIVTPPDRHACSELGACLNKRTAVKVLFVLKLGLALGPGCSGSGQPMTDGGPDASVVPLPSSPMSPIAACRQVETATAQREVMCQKMSQVDEQTYIDAHCPMEWYAQQMGDFDAGLLAYNQAAVTCLVTYQQDRPCNFPPESFPAVADAQCPLLAWGLALDGGTCASTYSCQPGLYCALSSSSVCGTCQPASPLGGPCGGSAQGATCSVGQCNGEACAPVVGVGGNCQYGSAVCEPLLSCQGICNAPGPIGSGCGTDMDCADGLTCPQTGQTTCVQRASVGQPCAYTSCELGLACAWSADGGTSCQTLIAYGSCVDDLDGGICLEGEVCADGGCVVLGPVSSSCTDTVECAVGQCVSATCTLLPAGDDCDRNADCVSNRCNIDAVIPVCLASCTQ